MQAAREVRDSRPTVPVLTVDAIGETIASRLGEVGSNWSEAQTELYRQLVSQMAEVQADLDLVRTGMQAIQPMENDGLGAGAECTGKGESDPGTSAAPGTWRTGIPFRPTTST